MGDDAGWKERAEDLIEQVDRVLITMGAADMLVMEEPTSMAEVGRSTNALGKMLYQVGYARSFLGYDHWTWYTTNTWKGSIPQHVVAKRVNKLLGMNLKDGKNYRGLESDAAHAAGLGLYYAGTVLGVDELQPYFGSSGGIVGK